MFRFVKYLVLAAAAGYALLAVGFEQKAALLVAGALFAFGIFRVAGFLVDLLLFLIVLGVLAYLFTPPQTQEDIRAVIEHYTGATLRIPGRDAPAPAAAPAPTAPAAATP